MAQDETEIRWTKKTKQSIAIVVGYVILSLFLLKTYPHNIYLKFGLPVVAMFLLVLPYSYKGKSKANITLLYGLVALSVLVISLFPGFFEEYYIRTSNIEIQVSRISAVPCEKLGGKFPDEPKWIFLLMNKDIKKIYTWYSPDKETQPFFWAKTYMDYSSISDIQEWYIISIKNKGKKDIKEFDIFGELSTMNFKYGPFDAKILHSGEAGLPKKGSFHLSVKNLQPGDKLLGFLEIYERDTSIQLQCFHKGSPFKCSINEFKLEECSPGLDSTALVVSEEDKDHRIEYPEYNGPEMKVYIINESSQFQETTTKVFYESVYPWVFEREP